MVPRKTVVKLDVKTTWTGVKSVSNEQMAQYRAMLTALDEADAEKRRCADAKNALESFVYSTREKLEDSEIEEVSTEEQRDAVRAELSEVSEWLYDEGEDATTKEYVDRLDALKKLSDPLLTRARELVEAPRLAQEMRDMVAEARDTLSTLPDTHSVTKGEADGALVVADEAIKWLDETEAAQAKLDVTAERVLTVTSIKEKFDKFERRLRTLLKRKKKPKKKAKKTKKKKTDAEEKPASEGSESTDDAKESKESTE